MTGFTGYQKFVVAVLSFLQFTIILDFMILSPLGAWLMPELSMTTTQFGTVVAAYAFSAGASGFLSAGFADRYDRKRLLLFFYTGFLIGTLLCGLANSYAFLLVARMFTGIFGGVVGSIAYAIITDVFPFEKRGRVMGFVQTAFAASQILGIPAGLFLSNHWGWHMPFFVIVGIGTVAGMVITVNLRPVDAHLKVQKTRSPIAHLLSTVTRPRYLQGFATTALLATGGFMLMPFGSAFSVYNLGLSMEQLPWVYLVTGLCTIVAGPVVGRLSDRYGKFRMFLFGSVLGMITVAVYTHLGRTPIEWVMAISAVMFVGISARMISSQALMSALPAPDERGSYMSVSSSVQQVSGGLASILAGLIVVQRTDNVLENFDILGYVVIAASMITVVMMSLIHRKIPEP